MRCLPRDAMLSAVYAVVMCLCVSVCEGPIYISGMAEARAVKFCTQVGFIKCYQTNKKSPPKGVWIWSRDLFKFLAPLQYLWNG